MSSQDTSPRTRTVSLRRARVSLVGAVVMTVICAAALVFFLALAVFSGAPAALLIAPLVGAVLSLVRARRWHRAIRQARTAPDEYRWRP